MTHAASHGVQPDRAGGTSVLFATASLGLGGAEKQIFLLLRELRKSEFRGSVVAFADGPWRKRIEELGVPVQIIRERGRWRKVLHAWRVLRSSDATILHTFGASAGYIFRIAALFAPLPVRISSERFAPGAKSRIERFVEKLLGASTSALICNSDHAAHYYVAQKIMPAERVMVVVNGIDREMNAERPRGASGEVCRIGYLANLYSKKNHEYLLQVLARLRASRIPVICDLVGDGPLRGELEDRAKSLDLSSMVVFHGSVPDPRRIFESLGLYVHLSVQEGLPNAVMEAMARGVPCVVSAVAGNQELIRNEVDGLVVHLDDPARTAMQIASLINDEPRRRRFAESAKRRIEKDFSVERMAERTVEVYRHALGRLHGRRAA